MTDWDKPLESSLGWVREHSERYAKTGGEEGRSFRERGVIIASGLMAGGALGGVFGASLRLLPKFKESWIHTPFFDYEPVSQGVSAALFIALCCYVWFRSLRNTREA